MDTSVYEMALTCSGKASHRACFKFKCSKQAHIHEIIAFNAINAVAGGWKRQPASMQKPRLLCGSRAGPGLHPPALGTFRCETVI